MKSVLPFRGNDVLKYSITYSETTPESLEDGDFSDTGYIVEPTTEELSDILKQAYMDYAIYSPTTLGSWESTSPKEDRDYFEKSINKYYGLHITHQDDSPLTKEEHDFITALLNNGKYSIDEEEDDYEWSGEKNFGVGGWIFGSLIGGFLGFQLGKAVGYGRAHEEFKQGGIMESVLKGKISKEDYFLIVRNWVYFTFNFPYKFVENAFEKEGHLKNHFVSKWQGYNDKQPSSSAVVDFYSNLSDDNREILVNYIQSNYGYSESDRLAIEKMPTGLVTHVISHWNAFCLNFPYGWLPKVFTHMTNHFEGKWSNAYEKVGSRGAINRFFTELDGGNQRLLTYWVYDNYTGYKFEQGGEAGTLFDEGLFTESSTYADGGELKGKFIAEIGVPYNYERVVEDEFEFTEFLSKTLTKKWFGNGVWKVEIVKPLFESNYRQKIVVEIDIPKGVTQINGLDKFEVIEFLSKTLTKKWFGNGVWSVEITSTYAGGGDVGKLYKDINSYQVVTEKGGFTTSSREELISKLEKMGYEYKGDVTKEETTSTNPIYDFSWKLNAPKFKGLLLMRNTPNQLRYESQDVYDSMSMEKGGIISDIELDKLHSSVTLIELNDLLQKKFPDSHKITVFKGRIVDFKSVNLKDAVFGGLNNSFNSYSQKRSGDKFSFPEGIDHSIEYCIKQGSENTNFEFVIYDKDFEPYTVLWGFKDEGTVDSSYVTKAVAFFQEAYGYPMSVQHTVMKQGGFIYNKKFRDGEDVSFEVHGGEKKYIGKLKKHEGTWYLLQSDIMPKSNLFSDDERSGFKYASLIGDSVSDGYKRGLIIYKKQSSQYADGGELMNINPKNFTINEIEDLVPDIRIISITKGTQFDKVGTREQIYPKKPSSIAKWRNTNLTISDYGIIDVSKGSENLYSDMIVYLADDRNNEQAYTIQLFSKENVKGMKNLISTFIQKMSKGGSTYADGGEIKRENEYLMGYEPYFEKNVRIASIDEESKTVRPTHGYFPNHPHSKKAISWSKRNGYKYIADGKQYADGGGIENSKEWKEYQVASNNINRFNRQNEFIMVDGKAVMNDVTKMPEYKILNEKFEESLKKVREMEKEVNNSYADGGGVSRERFNLSFNYNPSNLSNEDAKKIVKQYTNDWKHNNDFDNVSFYVFNLTKDKADELKRFLKMEDVYNIEIQKSNYAKGGMVVYLDGEKSETFKTKKALYDFVRKQVDTNVQKVEIDYGNRIIPTFDTYIIENGKLIHKGELIQPNIDKKEVEIKRLETEKNINKMMGYAEGGSTDDVEQNFKVGNIVELSESGWDNENYHDFFEGVDNVKLVITDVYTNKSQHQGFDEGVGMALYSTKRFDNNEIVPFDLYDYELIYVSKGKKFAKGGNAGDWSVTDITNAEYLGVIEFEDNEGEFHNFEVMETDDRLVFGGMTNSGFIESGYIEKDGFSTNETLQSLLEDLEVYYNDGAEYTSQIVFNQRMAKGGSTYADGGDVKKAERREWRLKYEQKALNNRLNNPRAKTVELYFVQGNYGQGFEDLTAHETITEAREELKVYNENESYPHRVITRRVNKEDYSKGNYKDGGAVKNKVYILTGYTASAHEDSYEQGELDHVSDWNEEYAKEFKSKESLIKFINENIIYVDYKESDFDWEAGDGKNIQTDVLCSYDDYNGYYPADEEDKSLWKDGKQKLYNVHYWIDVQAVVPTTYEGGGSVTYFDDMSKEDILSQTVVYDNDGETLDRYTVFTPDGSVFGMSENARGFNQFVGDESEIEQGTHLGKKLKSVPKEIEYAVLDRMADDDSYAKGGGVTSMSDEEIADEYDKILSVQILAGDIDEDEVEELSISEKREFLENYKDDYAKGGDITIDDIDEWQVVYDWASWKEMHPKYNVSYGQVVSDMGDFPAFYNNDLEENEQSYKDTWKERYNLKVVNIESINKLEDELWNHLVEKAKSENAFEDYIVEENERRRKLMLDTLDNYYPERHDESGSGGNYVFKHRGTEKELVLPDWGVDNISNRMYRISAEQSLKNHFDKKGDSTYTDGGGVTTNDKGGEAGSFSYDSINLKSDLNKYKNIDIRFKLIPNDGSEEDSDENDLSLNYVGEIYGGGIDSDEPFVELGFQVNDEADDSINLKSDLNKYKNIDIRFKLIPNDGSEEDGDENDLSLNYVGEIYGGGIDSDEPFVELGFQVTDKYAEGGGVDSDSYKKFGNDNAHLVNFDLSELDNFEEMQFNHFSKSSSKADSLQVLINNVEGDYSQLSPILSKIAEAQYPSDEFDEDNRQYADGGSVKKYKMYKLRAEGLNDFLNFLGTGVYINIKNFTVEPLGVPDVAVSFETNLSLSKIKSKLREVQDSHVMLETIKPIKEYTGERYADGGEIITHIDDRLSKDGEIMNPEKKRRLIEIRGKLLHKEKLSEKDTNVLKNEFNYLFSNGGEADALFEIVVVAKGLEKDGGQIIKDRFSINSISVNEAKNIAEKMWEKEMANSDFHIVEILTDTEYRNKYLSKKHDNGGGVEGDWCEEALTELIEETGNDELIITQDSENFKFCTISDEDAEYYVFVDEDSAHDYAVERVREDLEENPEYLNQNWLMGQMDESATESFFTQVYDEYNTSYATDIMLEDSEKYSNRLIEELVENGLMDEETANSENSESEAEELISDFVDLLTENQINEGENGYTHYKGNFGNEEAIKIVIKNNLIDIDSASENAVDEDGVAHFVSSYDGVQIDLPSGYVAYRVN